MNSFPLPILQRFAHPGVLCLSEARRLWTMRTQLDCGSGFLTFNDKTSGGRRQR